MRPASTLFSDSAGTSTTDATRYLAKTRLELGLDQFPRVLERDPLEDLAEESLHDHPLGGRRGDSARLEIEHRYGVDRAHGSAVSASHVVVVDLEHRVGARLGMFGEYPVVVGLVRFMAPW